MNIENNLSLLTDFASQIQYSQHAYIKNDGGVFKFTNEKTNFNDLNDLINNILKEQPQLTHEQRIQAYSAIEMIESHLQNKISGVFSFFIGTQAKNKINQSLESMHTAKEKLKLDRKEPTDEGHARLKFFKAASGKLKIQEASAQNDLQAIKEVSKKIWEKTKNYRDYEDLMTKFFQGEHFLIEEDNKDNNDYSFYEKLSKDPIVGAYLRGSSHYDHGTLNGQTGGPVPTKEDIEQGKVSNPQYEIVGPQVKALLFGRVKLALDEKGKPLFGKTFEQACEEAKKKGEPVPTKFKKYTFMQTEYAPDDSSIFTKNFWKHRVLSFVLYVSRKLAGSETPNVGPYGYGHADKGINEKSNPTVI